MLEPNIERYFMGFNLDGVRSHPGKLKDSEEHSRISSDIPRPNIEKNGKYQNYHEESRKHGEEPGKCISLVFSLLRETV